MPVSSCCNLSFKHASYTIDSRRAHRTGNTVSSGDLALVGVGWSLSAPVTGEKSEDGGLQRNLDVRVRVREGFGFKV